jgi:hypothetical protein
MAMSRKFFTQWLCLLAALCCLGSSVAANAQESSDAQPLATAAAIPPATNFGGLWWNSPAGSEAGWGINFAHQGDIIFATWFTYDQNGTALWLAMTAYKAGDGIYSGALYQTTGPAYNAVPFDPAKVTRFPVGSGTLTFVDANNGFFNYTVDGITQTKPITRQIFGPLPVCTFGTQLPLEFATNYQDIWWNPSESGWGINLTQQGSVIFATWFTYDLDGTSLWLTMTAEPTSQPGSYSGTLYRTSGPAFFTVPFDPNNVTQMPVGFATLTFANGNSATLAYTLYSFSQVKNITREVFQAPGTFCQ